MVKNLASVQEAWVQSLGQDNPLERGWLPTPVFLLETPTDGGAWQATVHGRKELDKTEWLSATFHYNNIFPFAKKFMNKDLWNLLHRLNLPTQLTNVE